MRPKDQPATQDDLAKLEDRIFKKLRLEKDRKSQQIITGNIQLNIGDFPVINVASMVGPYQFNTNFQSAPYVDFTDINRTESADTVVQIAPNSDLFLAHYYVAQWIYKTGAVAGFYLGVYPIVRSNITVKHHTVTWCAIGRASHYKRESVTQSWTHSYSNTTSDHLIQQDKNTPTQT